MIKDIFETIINIIKSRYFLLTVIILGVFSGLIVRLFDLQIVNEDYYLDTYIQKAEKTLYTSASRGLIYDRNGNVLAYNELTHAITIEDTLDSSTTKSDELNEIIKKAITIIENNGDEIVSDFGINIKKDGTFEYSITSETALTTFLKNIYGTELTGTNGEDYSNASAAETFDYLCNEKYGIDSGLGDEFDLKIAMVRYKLSLNSYAKYISTTLALNVSDETVAAISEAEADIKGVSVTEKSNRVYTDSEYFAPIIGYTGTISEDQMEQFAEDGEDEYISSDIVGKSGIESAYEYELQGKKGEQTVFVDSTGKVLSTVSQKDSVSGNDVYLTLDKDLQIATYNLLEQKIAGVLVNQIVNYDVDTTSTSSSDDEDDEEIVIPVKQVYYQMINNNVLDINHFSKKKASTVEKSMYSAYKNKLKSVTGELNNEMTGSPVVYNDLSDEYAEYNTFVFDELVSENVISSSMLDSSDSTYKKWLKGKISLKEMLMYCISQNWVNVSKLEVEAEYITADETYDALVEYSKNMIAQSDDFAKLIYYYCLYGGTISGTQICIALYDQGVLDYNEKWYNKLQAYDSYVTYTFITTQIKKLNITPAQIALDPCSGSTVVTDPDTGEVLALVTYPSYDNNKLSGTVDSEYWAKLISDQSTPLYNRATQTNTAPGSTFKMVSAMTGLENGVISTSTSITCTGLFDEITPSAKCWIYPASHGGENVTSALKVSCNYFFYKVGYELSVESNGDFSSELGLSRLEKYATLLGLNEKSGIEITESSPIFSTESSVRSAIGQGSHSYTCTQLARYVSTIANGGNNYYLTLINKIVDVNGKTVYECEPNLENTVDVSDSTWNAIHSGMRAVVTDGTVRSIYSSMDIDVAGKTGTAEENKNRNTHALFVCYAPYDNPEITVSTVIPYGDASSNSAEVARDVIKYYYGELKLKNILKGSANLPEVSGTHD